MVNRTEMGFLIPLDGRPTGFLFELVFAISGGENYTPNICMQISVETTPPLPHVFRGFGQADCGQHPSTFAKIFLNF